MGIEEKKLQNVSLGGGGLFSCFRRNVYRSALVPSNSPAVKNLHACFETFFLQSCTAAFLQNNEWRQQLNVFTQIYSKLTIHFSGKGMCGNRTSEWESIFQMRI